MGFMDGFTSDGTVDMKHTEYYNLMREAAKAELIGNAVKADVPGFYIQAMITGEKPEFLNTLDVEEESTGFHAEYEQITGAVVTIFEAWMKENGVESTAASLHRLIDTLAKNRIEELQTIKVNQEEHREQIKAAFEEMEKTWEPWRKCRLLPCVWILEVRKTRRQQWNRKRARPRPWIVGVATHAATIRD